MIAAQSSVSGSSYHVAIGIWHSFGLEAELKSCREIERHLGKLADDLNKAELIDAMKKFGIQQMVLTKEDDTPLPTEFEDEFQVIDPDRKGGFGITMW